MEAYKLKTVKQLILEAKDTSNVLKFGGDDVKDRDGEFKIPSARAGRFIISHEDRQTDCAYWLTGNSSIEKDVKKAIKGWTTDEWEEYCTIADDGAKITLENGKIVCRLKGKEIDPMAGYKEANEAKKLTVDKTGLQHVGFMMKDFKEKWSTKTMNSESKKVKNGEWMDLNTGSDMDAMVCVNSSMKLPKNTDDLSDFFGIGDSYYDPKKKEFVVIVGDKRGEKLFYFEGGKGAEKAMDWLDSFGEESVEESFGKAEKGGMHKKLGIDPKDKISDHYKSGKALADALLNANNGDIGKTSSELNFAANQGKDPDPIFHQAASELKKENKKKK